MLHLDHSSHAWAKRLSDQGAQIHFGDVDRSSCLHGGEARGARRGIWANVVAPGLIDKPFGRLAIAGRPSRTDAPVALGRQGTAWEVAARVVFLLSYEASYVIGQVRAVDGGLSTL